MQQQFVLPVASYSSRGSSNSRSVSYSLSSTGSPSEHGSSLGVSSAGVGTGVNLLLPVPALLDLAGYKENKEIEEKLYWETF